MCYGKGRMKARWFACALALGLALPGCSTLREIAGYAPQNEPTIQTQAETRWLLIKNPRFGDVASEPEYVWVEESKVPTTMRTLLLGKGSIIAPPEIVAKYGPPPGGGRISARQKVAVSTEPLRPDTTVRAVVAPAAGGTQAAAVSSNGVAGRESPRRGFVVLVDTTRIVVDLTSADGLRPGALVSLRRDKVPIVHPVTGEVLGELDEEVGTARIVETREKFSVAEIQSVAPGSEIQVKDRVVPK